VEGDVIERFGAAGIPKDNIAFARDTYLFEFPEPPDMLVNAFRRFYGPTMNAFDAASANGKDEALEDELQKLFASQNQARDGKTTSIPATFLKVTVTT